MNQTLLFIREDVYLPEQSLESLQEGGEIPMAFNEDIYFMGQRFKNLREKRNQTQMDAANAIGMSYSQISNLENATHVSRLDTIFKLMDHYGATGKDVLPERFWGKNAAESKLNHIEERIRKADPQKQEAIIRQFESLLDLMEL